MLALVILFVDLCKEILSLPVVVPKLPDISYYNPSNIWLKPNVIPSFENNAAFFELIEGHLGVKGKTSEIATSLLTQIKNNPLIRLRGPSGIGKTKALFDVLRREVGVFVDFSAVVHQDLQTFKQRVDSYIKLRNNNATTSQEDFEAMCTYEFYLVIASRLVALTITRNQNQDFEPLHGLLLQIDRLAADNYANFLRPIRDTIRKQYPSLARLTSLLADLSKENRFVLCIDEINTAVSINVNEFVSITSNAKRPLISLILRALGPLKDIPILLSGTGRIQDQLDYFASLTVKEFKSAEQVSRTGRPCETIDLRYNNVIFINNSFLFKQRIK